MIIAGDESSKKNTLVGVFLENTNEILEKLYTLFQDELTLEKLDDVLKAISNDYVKTELFEIIKKLNEEKILNKDINIDKIFSTIKEYYINSEIKNNTLLNKYELETRVEFDLEDLTSVINFRNDISKKTIEELSEEEILVPVEIALIINKNINDFSFVLYDGEHRYRSRLKIKETKIPAIIKLFNNIEEVELSSVRKNIFHGKRFEEDDVINFIRKKIDTAKEKNNFNKDFLKTLKEDIGISNRVFDKILFYLTYENVFPKESYPTWLAIEIMPTIKKLSNGNEEKRKEIISKIKQAIVKENKTNREFIREEIKNIKETGFTSFEMKEKEIKEKLTKKETPITEFEIEETKEIIRELQPTQEVETKIISENSKEKEEIKLELELLPLAEVILDKIALLKINIEENKVKNIEELKKKISEIDIKIKQTTELLK